MLRPRRITIATDATQPSPHVIDARRLLQPWSAVEGSGVPKLAPVIPHPPRQLILRRNESTEEGERNDRFSVLLALLGHPLRWYRYFHAARPAEPETPPTPTAPRFTLPKIHLPRWQTTPITATRGKAIASFALVSFLLVLPLQSLSSLSLFKTKTSLDQQLAELQTALEAGAAPTSLAPSLFQLVETFHDAEQQLGAGEELVKLAAFAPIPLGKLQSNAALFEAGLAISNTITAIADTLANFPKDARTADKARILLETVRALEPTIGDIKTSIAHINPRDVPEEARPHLPGIVNLVAAVERDLKTVGGVTEALLALLGADAPARFLVLFQNDEELRATGGFIGSFGILDIADGSLKKFDVSPSGSYAVQGQLTAYLRAPEALQTINSRFEFQDANWFPDFPASAETIMRLYELSHGATVDGVIAVNTGLLTGLLDILGPIISANNAAVIGSNTVIAQIYRDIQTNKARGLPPKQLIAALGPYLAGQLGAATPREFMQFVQLFNTARNQKDILVYAKDAGVAQALHTLAWDGAIDQTAEQDYLFVVQSNIGGGKTDTRIQQKIIERIEIQPDGYVRKQVTITRTHTGAPAVDPPNRMYARVYVPQGSALVSASGFMPPPESVFHAPETWYDEHPLLEAEKRGVYDSKSGVKIYEEFGKTVLAGWQLTPPGETSIIQLDYILPKRLFDTRVVRGAGLLRKQPSFSFSAAAIKQPGLRNTELITSVHLPDGWEPVWLTDTNLELGQRVIARRNNFTEDQFMGFVAAHK